MFGSIGQPVSGGKNDQTARMFLRHLRAEADRSGDRRSRERRRNLWRRVKGWLARH
ncbi:hypothetical protein [Arthrobacter sp. JSM 101049]|uniref:hypothetical protein n=1 Tax=Arthrobacter sp. JSM 101049 TaxID=929097 RepID=UPI00356A8D16